MLVLGVGGCCSGVGKTEVICRLLQASSGWGALKVSPIHRRFSEPASSPPVTHGLVGDYRIDADPGKPSSDTGRFREAGAARVAWLRSAPACLGEALDEALAGFEGLPGVIVEGNAPARERPPDGLLMVARVGQREVKPSARSLIGRADWLVLNRGGTGADRGVIARIERALGRAPGFRIDAAEPSDPGTVELLEAIRAWARR
jgi:hypothetical protein